MYRGYEPTKSGRQIKIMAQVTRKAMVSAPAFPGRPLVVRISVASWKRWHSNKP